MGHLWDLFDPSDPAETMGAPFQVDLRSRRLLASAAATKGLL